MSSSWARRSGRRLNSLIKKQIKTDGDFCTICRRAFTNNDLTFYGVAFGGVAVTGSCCKTKLDPTLGAGVYIDAASRGQL